MPTPSDFAAIIKRNQTRRETGTVYSTGSYVDTTIGSTINDASRERLDELKRSLLVDAERTFGNEFDAAEVATTYQSLLEITDGLDLGDTTTHAIKFDAHSDNEIEIDEALSEPSGARSGRASEEAEKYIVQIFHAGDEVTGLVAGPVPYAHGNALYVSRSPQAVAAEDIVIGKKAGQVTRTAFKEATGSLSTNHVGNAESVRKRVLRLLNMNPDEFETERAYRAKRRDHTRAALGRRSSVAPDSL